MKWKLLVILALVLAAAVVGVVLVGKKGSRPAVTVTLRVAVSPREQLDTAIALANSARFKYMAGTESGVKPQLAQQLSVKAVPNTAVLQDLCGDQVKLSLDSRKIE
jgi:hypothetical protein